MPLVDCMPLRSHPAFRVSNLEDLSGAVSAHLAARFVKLPVDHAPIEACANSFKLPNSSLWFCSYGMPVALRFPEPDHVRVQFHHAGIGATWLGDDLFPVTPERGCLSATEAEIDFGPGFEQVVWRIPKDVLVRKLSGMMDSAVPQDLAFDPCLKLDTPQGRTVRQILSCLLQVADAAPGATSTIVMAELEQAMITALLGAAEHRCRDQLAKKPTGAAPWQVRRAEDYIRANWSRPLSIDDLAAQTGASVRSIFRAFRKSRDYTPLEFARQVRLGHAKHMLEAPDDSTTVTAVAFACGFGDLGRFSKDFTQAFGELPSLVLSRSRGAAVH